MKRKDGKKKEEFIDDGRTIADMDYEHITGYKSKKERKKHDEIRSLDLTRQERRAIYKAAFSQYMPMFACFIVAFILVIVFLYFFWLS